MAGIGQLNMGRSLIPETNKPLISFDKRSMLNSSTSSNSPVVPTSTPVIGTPSSTIGSNSNVMESQGQNDISSSMFNLRLSNNTNANSNQFNDLSNIRSNFLNNKNSESSSILSSFNNANNNINGFNTTSNRILNDFPSSNFISGSNNALTVTSTINSSYSNSKSLQNQASQNHNLHQQSSNNLRIIASTGNSNNNDSMVFSILDPSEFPPIRSGSGNNPSQTATGSTNNSSFNSNQKLVGNNTNTSINQQQSHQQQKKFLFATSSSSVANFVSGKMLSNKAPFHQNLGEMNGNQNGPEFSIDQDFPALPGSSAALAAANSSLSNSNNNVPSSVNQQQQHQNFNSSSHNLQNNSSNNLSHSLHQSFGNSNSASNTAFSMTDIPKNMITDKFGMIGLLKLIRVGDHDATLNMLAPGLDLNSLNIKWDTSEEMFNTFVSPCHDSSTGRTQDIDYPVPSEYLIHQMMPPDYLPDPPMEKLAESTLFWLFYNCCREEIQLVAAKELYQRHWRFHTKKQIWLTRVPNENVTVESSSEQGYYHYWDRMNAQKLKSHMKIYYSELDDAPASFRLSSGLLSASVRLDVN